MPIQCESEAGISSRVNDDVFMVHSRVWRSCALLFAFLAFAWYASGMLLYAAAISGYAQYVLPVAPVFLYGPHLIYCILICGSWLIVARATVVYKIDIIFVQLLSISGTIWFMTFLF